MGESLVDVRLKSQHASPLASQKTACRWWTPASLRRDVASCGTGEST
ncbi:hypothetical protein RSSM_04604 [Rhodopirellula sallentina SM41]|uniref:Uncharacterized protein n=1 Tax=Rhodopirellula sallentina SM41 TaxID=1263870 RepID=M5TXT5_9BACT|nr:hypothetical protein RSSM_04604 [Rhodopirellula sallentina SM41]